MSKYPTLFSPFKLGRLATARAQWQELMDRWHGRPSAPQPEAAARVIPIRVA